jgi:Domain of unknown function (DUF4129)
VVSEFVRLARGVFGLVDVGVRLAIGAPGRQTQPDDLGPVDQDPNDIRTDACQILDAKCNPPKPKPKPPSEPRDPPNINFSLGNVLVFILVALLIAAIVAAVIWYVRSASPRVRAHGDDADDFEVISERIIDHSRAPSDWRAAAAEHLAAGRYREALRCRYRALVGDLARRGLLDEIPGRTTGEERIQLADLAPDSSPAFSRASSMFDDVWYGAADVSRADHDRFVAEEDLVLATAPRRGPERLR